MSVHMYGNINGPYQPPKIDVFEQAKEQSNKPIRFRDTEAGKDLPTVTLNISSEGLKALHGTKLPGSADVEAMQKQRKFEFEHQPVEEFYNRISREFGEKIEKMRVENPDKKVTITDKGNTLLDCFKSIADEISAGYADDTRLRFVIDSDSDDGYRRLSKNEELDILQQEFEDFVDVRFGKTHQENVELVTKQMEAVIKVNNIEMIFLRMFSFASRQISG